jgi:hypothetical protein
MSKSNQKKKTPSDKAKTKVSPYKQAQTASAATAMPFAKKGSKGK